MAKKKYSTPVWIDADDEVVFPSGGSQEIIGEDNIFGFEDDALKAALKDYGYFALEEIDGYGDDGYYDGIITWDEYNAWLADNPQP